MSIAHFDPNEPEIQQQPLAVAHDPKKFAVYDNETHPTFLLEAVLEGKPWTLKAYYGQILGVADVPKELDVNLAPALQHYEKIENYELLVDNPLTDSFDSKNQVMNTTGSGTTYSFHRVNVNDYFVVESNIGRLGLFMVKEVVRSTHEKNSIANITYQLVEEIAPGNLKYANLEEKVTSVKVFSKARLIENQNPILLKKTYTDVRNLGATFRVLANEYFRLFYRQERGTLFAPGQNKYIYDPFLVDFFNRVVGSDVVPDKQFMLLLSEDNDPIFKTNTIWTLLQRRGIENLNFSNTAMMLVEQSFFDHVLLAKSAFFSNTDYTVYPRNHDRSMEITDRKTNWQIASVPRYRSVPGGSSATENFEFQQTVTHYGEVFDYTQETMTVAGAIVPLFKPVMVGTSYIFGRHFFDEEPSCVLEIALLDYIRRDNINVDQIYALTKAFPKLNRLEQFYYGPMIMVMIRDVMRGAYA